MHLVAASLLSALLTLFLHTSKVEGMLTENVAKFRQRLRSDVEQDPGLLTAFDITPITATRAATQFRDAVEQVVKPTDPYAAELDSNLIYMAIKENYNTIAKDGLIDAYGVALPKILQLKGVLNSKNVNSLADQFATIIKATMTEENALNKPEHRIPVLVHGLGAFLVKNGLVQKDVFYLVGVLSADSVYFQPKFKTM